MTPLDYALIGFIVMVVVVGVFGFVMANREE